MLRLSSCFVALVLVIGCGSRRNTAEVRDPAPRGRSGTTRLSSAETARRPSKPTTKTKPELHPLARHYVSSYVEVDAATLEHLTGEKRAELFERVPMEAFVYAYADLDEKSATHVRGSYLEDPFPHRDEPLLLLRASKTGDRPVVTTADGVEVAVDWARISDGSTAHPAVASTPRALASFPNVAALKTSALQDPNVDSGWVARALTPLMTGVAAEISTDEFWQTQERVRGSVRAAAADIDACRDRVSAKFDPQVRAGTSTAEAPSGRTITVKSPRALQAEDRASKQSDEVCGNRATLQKKLAAIYEAEDSKIRARLASERARTFERATARFRVPPYRG